MFIKHHFIMRVDGYKMRLSQLTPDSDFLYPTIFVCICVFVPFYSYIYTLKIKLVLYIRKSTLRFFFSIRNFLVCLPKTKYNGLCIILTLITIQKEAGQGLVYITFMCVCGPWSFDDSYILPEALLPHGVQGRRLNNLLKLKNITRYVLNC